MQKVILLNFEQNDQEGGKWAKPRYAGPHRMSKTAATAQKKRPNESRQFVADRCHHCGTPGPNEDQDRFALQATGRIYKDAWFPGRHLNISEF